MHAGPLGKTTKRHLWTCGRSSGVGFLRFTNQKATERRQVKVNRRVFAFPFTGLAVTLDFSTAAGDREHFDGR